VAVGLRLALALELEWGRIQGGGVPDSLPVFGGVATHFQSFAGKVESCRNWDSTGKHSGYAEAKTHSITG
jgi:hypothetical protein